MGGTNDHADRVAQITEQALAIAASAPDALKQVVFEKTFDELAGGGARSERTPKSVGGKRRMPATTKGDPTDGQASPDPVKVLTEGINRTEHPEIANAPIFLDRALILLRIANDEFDIDGLTAVQIAKILTDKFRLRVTDPSIREALDKADKYVDRVPRKSGGNLYRLMQPGEAYIDGGGANSAPKSNKSRNSTRSKKASSRTTKASVTRKGAKPKSTANPRAGNAGEAKSKPRRTSTLGPKGQVEVLIENGFFSEARTVQDIRDHLRHKRGVSFSSNELAPALVRLIRQGRLDRERNPENQYEYRAHT